MKKVILSVVLFLSIPAALSAQATATSKLVWDQTATSAAEAQSFTYKHYSDGSNTGVVLAGVTCTGTAPIVCQATIPNYSVGSHTLTLSASNAAGESVKSAVFSFTFIGIPSAPSNLRIG